MRGVGLSGQCCPHPRCRIVGSLAGRGCRPTVSGYPPTGASPQRPSSCPQPSCRRHHAAATASPRTSGPAVGLKPAPGGPSSTACWTRLCHSTPGTVPWFPHGTETRTRPSRSGASWDTGTREGVRQWELDLVLLQVLFYRGRLRASSARQPSVGPPARVLQPGVNPRDLQPSVSPVFRVIYKTRIVVDAALEAEPVALIVGQIATTLEAGSQSKDSHAESCGRSRNICGYRSSKVSEYMFYFNA